ncbi:hypothetical protein GCM10009836_51200 [Pseudonocardia ailaonensis]|uniref:HTH marR-type domain-containing protein n=1 Tax=Pseudonocardia ailaonensis TaxID=367279 RepID=A0ABN2NDP3_9PSEU
MRIPDLQAIGLAVKRLQHRHHRELDDRLRSIGTTLSQWDALRHVAAHPGASTHELAELTFMTDQSFGALAIKLAGLGLVTRTPGRGRVIHHEITAEGAALRRKGAGLADEVLTASFAPLSPAERETLHLLLARVLEEGSPRVAVPQGGEAGSRRVDLQAAMSGRADRRPETSAPGGRESGGPGLP